MADAEKFMIKWRGQESGPFTANEIRERLDALEIGVWHEVNSNGNWMVVDAFLKFVEGGGAKKSKRRGASAIEDGEISQAKEKGRKELGDRKFKGRRFRMLYALLGITLGPLGIHNFYAGRWQIALAQIGFTAAVYFTSLHLLIPYLWVCLEIIIVWQDGDGRGMI
ncbi:TM2 domain-containing protein [Verrucomicrobia bacterium]|nr:TM2 domain-containing protein [Verrucomicrobiota bacterium]